MPIIHCTDFDDRYRVLMRLRDAAGPDRYGDIYTTGNDGLDLACPQDVAEAAGFVAAGGDTDREPGDSADDRPRRRPRKTATPPVE